MTVHFLQNRIMLVTKSKWSMSISRLYELYAGVITELEFMYRLMQLVTEDNCLEVDNLPNVEDVKEYVNRQPTTKDGWDSLRTFRIEAHVGITTTKQREQARRDEQFNHRHGVRILRKHWNDSLRDTRENTPSSQDVSGA